MLTLKLEFSPLIFEEELGFFLPQVEGFKPTEFRRGDLPAVVMGDVSRTKNRSYVIVEYTRRHNAKLYKKMVDDRVPKVSFTKDECVLWLRPPTPSRPDSMPRFTFSLPIGRVTTTARTLFFYLEEGCALPLRSTCGNSTCVNPHHQWPLSMAGRGTDVDTGKITMHDLRDHFWTRDKK